VWAAAGTAHSLALCADGSVVGWGSDQYGQATLPGGLAQVRWLAAGRYHSLALVNGGVSEPELRLSRPVRAGSGYCVWAATMEGRRYAFEFKESLGDPEWRILSWMRGYGWGLRRPATDPGPTVGRRHRFYRLRCTNGW
jgi:hypothetical protein